MKKIAIVTIYGNLNYGNRLQNYALQEILCAAGYEVETLQCIKSITKEILKKIYFEYQLVIGIKFARRKLRMNRFNKRYIHTKKIYSITGLIPDNVASKYDYFVVGSDQVWNPVSKERHNYFLRFAAPEQRICISPSIGVSAIPESCCLEYKDCLRGFRLLSCREDDGAKEIERLSGKKCEHLLDPTLVVSEKTWRNISSNLPINQKYVLVFFLGDIKDQVRGIIMSYAREKGYLVIEVTDPKSEFFAISPEEFVWIVDHAQLVFTDSFHATAFSINLKTPFYAFSRHEREEFFNHMSSRLKSLVKLFSLESRYIESDVFTISDDCDFSMTNDILERERNKFEKYLYRCFDNTTSVF